MKKIVLLTLLLLSGCTTFNHIEVVSPEVGYLTRDVYTVNPELAWKKPVGYTGTYDLVVYTRGVLNRWTKSEPNRVVYFREGLDRSTHKVELSLNKDYRYYWAVKKSNDNSEGAWAKFNFYMFGGFFAFWWLDMPFRFDIEAGG